ncbi:MAG: helix-turn-helix transcriptional regulator [Deltaproteobacteria bacterium]|nr:helix-turn-helix transcriptional regulator [Deltaproteobacteria bacterium]
MNEKNFELVDGSGNVFRDFGDPDADVKQVKAILAAGIIAVLDERGLTAREAGEITGYPAADVSCVRNADLERFTVDRLKKMLVALDDHSRA